MTHMTHKEYAESLRRIADFFEAHPELPLPHDASEFRYFGGYDQEKIASVVKALGWCDKNPTQDSSSLFEFSRSFGMIKFVAITQRDNVCRRVEVGRKQVERQVIPERVIEEHEEIIYDWDCTGSVLKGSENVPGSEIALVAKQGDAEGTAA